MTKQIAKLLKATIQESSDLKQIAKQLAQKGRGGDSMLVHITPREASMLKDAGGAGTINPDTGLMEFYDGFKISDYADFDAPNIRTGGYNTISQPELNYGFNAPATYEYSDLTKQKAINQYGGSTSATPYPAVTRNQTMDDRFAAQAIAETEFPSGMAARPDLGRVALAQPSTYFTPTGYVNPFQYEMERSDYSPPLPEPKPLGFLDRIGQRLQQPETLEKLGIAGLQSLPAIIAARQSAAQGRQAKEELQAMAAPYKQRGEAMVQQAERGELTPVEQQQIQALRARAAQGAAGRGGVGAEQAAVQEQAFLQQLLANKYDMGLKIANIGDQIAAGAIRTGLQADQYVNELTSNYFTTLARSMGGQAPFTQPQQIQQPR